MVGLFDRDVFLKLASTDLWDATVSGFGLTRTIRLPSCSIDGCARSIRRWFPDEAYRAGVMERVAVIVGAAEVFTDELNESAQRHPAFLEIMNTPDIDSGEALLIAAAQLLEDPSLMVTGDKRFISSLRANHPAMYAKVRHQLVSFEGCVLKACETEGTSFVVERLRGAASCDNVIRMALGSGPETDEQSFLQAFASFDPLRPD